MRSSVQSSGSQSASGPVLGNKEMIWASFAFSHSFSCSWIQYSFTRVSQKLYNIFIHASLQCIYNMIEAVQVVEDINFGGLHHGSWCADILCFASLCMWFESHIDKCATVLFWNLCFTSSNWGLKPQKQPKTIFKQKLITVQWPDGSRSFAQFTRTSTIRQGEVALKPLILKLYSKSKRQIQQTAIEEYQANSASHSPVWFVNFTTLAKAPEQQNCASYYQNIAKFFTHSSIFFVK